MLKSLATQPVLRGFYRRFWEARYGVKKSDIFLVSYPRSGNTWIRFMLLQARPDFTENDFQRIQEIIPDMHSIKPWFKCERTSIIKSHLNFWQPFRRVIYLVRDARDATFSNWCYQSDEGTFTGSFEHYLSSSYWPSTWSEHVEGWVDTVETRLVVRYEDMVKNPAVELQKIISLLGWSVPESRISEIISLSTKEKMRALEQAQRLSLHRVGNDKKNWRQAFTPQLESAFLNSISPKARFYLNPY
jgi:estrone sulfotransferase